MNEPPGTIRWTTAIGFVMVVVTLYVLSYAPVVRMTAFRPRYPLYKPVEWMVDETPLRVPFMWWGDMWGVGDQLERACAIRQIFVEFEGGGETIR